MNKWGQLRQAGLADWANPLFMFSISFSKKASELGAGATFCRSLSFLSRLL